MMHPPAVWKTGEVFHVVADETIPRHKIPSRLTDVERRLMEYLSRNKKLITCVGNIGTGKSSLIKFLAYHTGTNALFELPDEGFEDHLPSGNPGLYPLLATAKDAAKRTLGKYYAAINEFIECQRREAIEGPAWLAAKRNLERASLDIQHAYLDLRKMQLQTLASLKGSTYIDGYPMADRYAFCEVLHRDMDIPYLTKEALEIVDHRLDKDFGELPRPDLLILLTGEAKILLNNIRERNRKEEEKEGDLPEGLIRLVEALHHRYNRFAEILQKTGWYSGPLLVVDITKIDFVSNVRHLIAIFEGIDKLLVPGDYRIC